jgi:hypothetical protein
MLVDGRGDFQATVSPQEHAIDDLQAWETQLLHMPPPSITSSSERKRCQGSSKLETFEGKQDMTAARNATRQLPTLVRKQCSSTGGGGRSGFVVAPGLDYAWMCKPLLHDSDAASPWSALAQSLILICGMTAVVHLMAKAAAMV